MGQKQSRQKSPLALKTTSKDFKERKDPMYDNDVNVSGFTSAEKEPIQTIVVCSESGWFPDQIQPSVDDNVLWIGYCNASKLIKLTAMGQVILESQYIGGLVYNAAFSTSGEVLVSTYGNGQVRRIKSNGQLASDFCSVQPRFVFDISTTSSSVYVLAGHLGGKKSSDRIIFEFNHEGDQIRTISRVNHVRRLFHNPQYISCSSDKQMCVVDKEHKLHGSLLLGTYKVSSIHIETLTKSTWFAGNVNERHYHFTDAECYNGDIFLMDPCKIYLLYGDMRTFHVFVNNTHLKSWPSSMCVYSGCLYVGDEQGRVYFIKSNKLYNRWERTKVSTS